MKASAPESSPFTILVKSSALARTVAAASGIGSLERSRLHRSVVHLEDPGAAPFAAQHELDVEVESDRCRRVHLGRKDLVEELGRRPRRGPWAISPGPLARHDRGLHRLDRLGEDLDDAIGRLTVDAQRRGEADHLETHGAAVEPPLPGFVLDHLARLVRIGEARDRSSRPPRARCRP